MGGEQSHESHEGKDREEKKHEAPANKEKSSDSQDSPGELPQCQMGNRKVDSMSFMISCTNWY